MERIILDIVAINYSINMTDFMGGIFVYAFNPYISIFGNLTWGIIFGFIGVAIYAQSERQMLTTFGYLVIVGIIFSVILPIGLIAIFGLLSAFIVGSILYHTIVESN